MKLYRKTLCLFLLAGVMLVAGGHRDAMASETWPAELETTDNEEFRNADSPLVILISSDIWQQNGGSFALEVDNIDVTSMVAVDKQRLIYQPVEALEPGSHEIRLYEVTAEGEYIEQAYWSFDVQAGQDGAVAQNSESRESSEGAPDGDPSVFRVTSDNSIEVSQRIFDENINSPYRDTTVSGAGSSAITFENGNWSFSGTGNYFIESEKELAQSGNEIDLGEYSMSLRYSGEQMNLAASLGHQDVGIDSLAMSSFNRRGASISVGTAGDGLKVTGFSLSSDSLTGAEDIAGAKSDSGNVSGAAVVGRPVWGEDAKLELTGLFFNSRGGQNSIGVGGGLDASERPEGQGGALIADSYWADDRLRVRGEYAFSNMDLDGSGALDSDRASAEAVNFSYVLIKDDGEEETPVSLTVGAKWERVDTFFYSLANPGLAADRDSLSAFANMYWGALSVNGRAMVETNNTDDLAGIATDRIVSGGLDGSYSFTIDREGPDDMAWLGTPYVGFGANVTNALRADTPVGYLGDDTDNAVINYYGNIGTSYERWNWQLGYNRSAYEDDTNISQDTVNEMIDLSAYWTVSDALNISAGTQFNRYVQKDDGERAYNVTGNLGLQAILIPDTLRASVDYNMNLSSGSGDIPDRHLVSGEMEWTLIPVDVNKPGVALAFRGAMEKENGNSDSALDDTKYEGFVVLRFKAPLAN